MAIGLPGGGGYSGVPSGWGTYNAKYPWLSNWTEEYIPHYFINQPQQFQRELDPYARALLGRAFTTKYGEDTELKEYEKTPEVTPLWSWNDPATGEPMVGATPPMRAENYFVTEGQEQVEKFKEVPIEGAIKTREAAPAEYGQTAKTAPETPSAQLWQQFGGAGLQPMFEQYITGILDMAKDSFMQQMQSMWPTQQKAKVPEWQTAKQR